MAPNPYNYMWDIAIVIVIVVFTSDWFLPLDWFLLLDVFVIFRITRYENNKGFRKIKK